MLMLFVAAAGVFCGYHVNWIRQRHEFLTRNDARKIEYERLKRAVVFHLEKLYNPRSTPKHSFNFLWLFGEPPEKTITLIYPGDFPREEAELGERVFPEADFYLEIYSPDTLILEPPKP
jgi:hypothetical protein